MNITIERSKKQPTDHSLGKNNLSSGKVDVFYYGHPHTTSINKVDTSKQLQQQQQQLHQQHIQLRHHHQQQQHLLHQQQQQQQQQHNNMMMDKYDITGYDFQNTSSNISAQNDNNIKMNKIQNIQVSALQRCASSSSLKRKFPMKTTTTASLLSSSLSSSAIQTTVTTTTSSSSSITSPSPTTTLCNPSPSSNNSSMSSQLRHHLEFSRGLRTDVSLVPPIRQTASIFKQPVTVYKIQDSKVKNDLKHGIHQDKPKQLFWEKRLEGLNACDITGTEFNSIDLPKSIKSVGPNINEQTLLQSIATALHCSNHPITGQTASKAALLSNSGVFLNPEQPLMHSITINDDDIRKQEDRVNLARRRLQDVLKG